MANAGHDTTRVLHVDDDPQFGEMVATTLEWIDESLVVETETSAQVAFERLFDADEQFACIVSDYEMPGMSGQEFLEAVRERRPDLPFILFTGRGSEAVASRAISADVTGYLRKGPGTDRYRRLADLIDDAVNRRRSQDQGDRSESSPTHSSRMRLP